MGGGGGGGGGSAWSDDPNPGGRGGNGGGLVYLQLDKLELNGKILAEGEILSSDHHNFANIKAITTRLRGKIVRPKLFPLKSTTGNDDVI